MKLVFLVLVVMTYAQVCPTSYFYNGQRCAPCLPNCNCTKQNTCTSCLSGFTYDATFQNCLPCPAQTNPVNIGCKECCYQVQGPAFVCSTCAKGSYIYQIGGQCIYLQGCLNITSQGICTSCDTLYFSSQGACTQCHSSCATCLDASACLTCAVGYYNGSNVNYALCQACSLGCQVCSSGSACTSCQLGYRLNGGSCTACSQAICDVCTAVACTTCNSVSRLIGTQCYLCTDGSKQGSLGCTKCSSTATRIICTECSNGYYLNSGTQQCVACTTTYPNSALCNSTNVIQCLNDNSATLTSRFYLINNICVANSNSCKDMLDSSGKCTSCYFDALSGYYTLTGSQICQLCSVTGCNNYSKTCQCQACSTGYQFINNLCNACQSLHCSACQTTVTKCQKCLASYGLMSTACMSCQPLNCFNCNGDNTKCVVCNTGYYQNNGLCYQCQANCISCMSNTLCTSCMVGYFLQNNGRCARLPTNCIDIDVTTLGSTIGKCQRCSYGYMLIDGNCYACSNSLLNLDMCDQYHCPDYYIKLNEKWLNTVIMLWLLLLGININ